MKGLCDVSQEAEVRSKVSYRLASGFDLCDQSQHGNCSVFFDIMVSRMWLHWWWGGGGVIGEL